MRCNTGGVEMGQVGSGGMEKREWNRRNRKKIEDWARKSVEEKEKENANVSIETHNNSPLFTFTQLPRTTTKRAMPLSEATPRRFA